MYNYFLHVRTYFVLKRKLINEFIIFKKSNHYTPFVILCAPRSGSTLLHTYLNYHRNIHSHGEILRELRRQQSSSRDFISTTVFKPYSTNVKAVGMKLFYEYFGELSPFHKSFQEIVNRKDIRIIHLIRNDVLRLYVSLKLAEKTNVWSTGKPTEPDYANKIVVDLDDYRAFKSAYLERQELFKKMFGEHSTITISYEELTSDGDAVLHNVQQFLKVPEQTLKSLLKKQNQGEIDRYVLNCHELVSAGLLL